MAGESLRTNYVKCQLRPIDFADYQVPLTEAEKLQLRQIFPQGVCNYDRPGVDQHPLAGTWLNYTGPGTFTVDGRSGN